VFTPFELIERLIPLPRKHTIRFHGILAPASGHRAMVVPATTTPAPPREATGPEPPARYQLPWAELLRRVFLVDALDCPRCHGRMRIVAAVTDPDAVERILRHLGEHPAPPPSQALARRQSWIRRLSSARPAPTWTPARSLPLAPYARRGESCLAGISPGIGILVLVRQGS